ncbi:LPXTG-motif cell wall anchor [Niveomyces insectorum RCEF 264]|uniref:LPXTG-motif cell wall anchor n=1 Tax=Niveomyces insectorum RCEF 264 TaxID=1081102 RepID=A0A167WBK0_9HYPO|nr:LPXTG-motif cell wall anchor [Niveomyces insectorum RCEF 264]
MTSTITTITVTGTPTAFLPLATAWPSGADCTSNIYLFGSNTFLAWDPLYGASMVTSARSCLPPQVTTWWSQPSSDVYTALGPTFQCPAAYTAALTAVVAGSLYETYCCASQYTLFVPRPNDDNDANDADDFPSQCTSTVTSGQTFAYFTLGQSTTVVMTTPATVFAIPVNGFDFTPGTPTSSPATTSASTSARAETTTVTAKSTSTISAGTSAGITVAAIAGVAMVVGTAFLLLRRKRQRRAAEGGRAHTAPHEPPKELDGSGAHELPVGPIEVPSR